MNSEKNNSRSAEGLLPVVCSAGLSVKLQVEERCPFWAERQAICQASVSALSIDAQRSRVCGSEDFDRCGIYLAYLLRRTRPQRSDSDWLDVA